MMSKTLSLPRQLTKGAKAVARARQYATASNHAQDPTDLDTITTLPNGLRIATAEQAGHFSGVGVYIDAGSRYESNALRGTSHIIDRLAFKSTTKRSADQMLEAMEQMGGNIQCASSRESLMYQAATFNAAVPDTVAMLAETIRDPNITDEEVFRQLETADYEIGEIWGKPELILPELVHMAAYKDNTLGNPLLCPKDRLDQIDSRTIEAYRKAFFKPERTVVAFAGVNHQEAVRLTEQYFGDMKDPAASIARPSTSSEAQQVQPPYPTSQLPPQKDSGLMSRLFSKNLSTSASQSATVSPLDPSDIIPHPLDQPINYDQPSHYTGGFLTLPPLEIPPNPALPRVSHIHLAFESLPISSPDIYALATLQTLLGGGGSFSAGGPGKGMYSRLYTNVLNQYGWVENCVAFNHAYTDSGLFGISASCATQFVPRMLDTMARELSLLSTETGLGRLSEIEVKRAKNQLRSSLLMNLESRMVELEDLGRQVQVHGRRIPVKEMVANIENVTMSDLRRVAKQVFSGQVHNVGNGSGAPTVVLQQGEEENVKLKEIPWSDIQERIAKWGLGRR
ncbi:Mitochondrial-processing peptidase subunit alpha [Fulvia fulva]|uniref:Mitochondrial-processing peptidase subunit alpha n=1 Tax=Passalora fulva TaxID=5499 RepID=A0A9Q8P5E6_PASFU|nr:Mitochondrial-processing peptidase subunit alpha [Fulvia fulva]KAK4631598.1 Mitochondrial-processing peptidase subunit alpha [Fulvia fulva]KAK4633741.1 Mitochondrial-processing peptidase subunit alpha [Fulvia fulva]UJO13816.1 Mitochondrial-processing peptidase subunit alpha [Fulvia fulva]WPV11234.1 Mitochondrial-processing peptidase subunit alpha [Fulvia fulva]WPV26649.1 Mitochondrial-processing peptidase subunit alpha [Fulvia fulva]